MASSRFFSLVAILALVAGAAFSRTGMAAEVLDNEKLMEMIKGKLSPKVIMSKIAASPADCHFSSLVKDSILIQTACMEAQSDPKWTAQEIDTLQMEVNRLAKQGISDLKNLVNLFLTSVENGDDDESQQYRELMQRLVRAGSTVVPNLRENLTLESDRKRAGVLRALGRIGDKSPELMKDIIALLDDKVNPVRAQAAKTVASLANSETSERLITMLSRRDTKNDGVALALGYMRYEPAIAPLVQVLKTSRDSDERISAAFALGEIRAKTFGATDQLLMGVLDERDERLRGVCAKALALIGDKRAPSYIAKAFDRFRPGRVEMLRDLAEFRTIYVVKFLADNLDNDDNEIRKVAAAMLESLTGEKYDTKEQWIGYIELLNLRPDWQEAKEANKLPEPQEPK